MNAHNLEARIVKLEVSRRRPDELLLIWRRPNGDVRAAASGANFAPGDRVICLEWFGDSELPPPRWFGKRSEFSIIEHEYLRRSLRRFLTRAENGGRAWSTGFVNIPRVPVERIRELYNSDLLYMIFGVAT